ncbi:hypothetical protein AURDEDRAFT_177570 [Auricularia subglabra TFB-10046 SS5]|uniref:Uncharacterized protein n=1 Tax=Auricularia subglabra (strain TFB-10046 / SS5) TaxID=717982 RepID=J0D3T4_AURST|nr:hypothetical protein AURDEDRAFT_177570 [Auricularia subglabra TFB-10046 SS5]
MAGVDELLEWMAPRVSDLDLAPGSTEDVEASEINEGLGQQRVVTTEDEPAQARNTCRATRATRATAITAQLKLAAIAEEDSDTTSAGIQSDDGPLEISDSEEPEEEFFVVDDELELESPMAEPDLPASLGSPESPANTVESPVVDIPSVCPKGRRKVGKAEAAKLAKAAEKAAAKALAAESSKSYIIQIPQLASEAERAVEIKKNLSWTCFRTTVILAIGLASTEDAARDYPPDKGTLSYRFTELRGKFTQLDGEDDYLQFLAALDSRQKQKSNVLAKVWLSCPDASQPAKKGKGSSKGAPPEGEPLVGDPVQRKFVAELKAQIGPCADPSCKIVHCKITRDGLHTQVTEFMFVHWAKHLEKAVEGVTYNRPPKTNILWEPYHPAGTVQAEVAGNPILAPLRPGARASRTDKMTEADKRTETVMEIIKAQAESTTKTTEMMSSLMKSFTEQFGQAASTQLGQATSAQLGHATHLGHTTQLAPDMRVYPLIEEVLAAMTREEKDRGIPKPWNYSQYLGAFEDSLGWRFVNDMCDGSRTFETLRQEFVEELRGIQHGPLRSIWDRFAFEADKVRNEGK